MTGATATNPTVEPDYDALLRANLQRVFNERDPVRRDAAIADLYVADPIMFEPDAIVSGRQAISDIAGKLLDNFGPDFTFVPEGNGLGHHGMGMLRWRAGTPGNPAMVLGADTAEIIEGRIARLWVLLDLAPST
ncbi:nuclear transport factor 2 family protein [Segnochrobactrum spirostomi]|uniref:Nuclear transport factor 2 family protein n=1 Tax=Segnochrobactrum spirostomi TaxID=2608987 RepID=A0A6A7YA71_9HYPH|nr:nuclear transport factor 2 family protein [Segnochrobactrum spirostomi]MQT14552.1 nuclear transport factor 2 family protein [Segnochrobactrum spirostomi]